MLSYSAQVPNFKDNCFVIRGAKRNVCPSRGLWGNWTRLKLASRHSWIIKARKLGSLSSSHFEGRTANASKARRPWARIGSESNSREREERPDIAKAKISQSRQRTEHLENRLNRLKRMAHDRQGSKAYQHRHGFYSQSYLAWLDNGSLFESSKFSLCWLRIQGWAILLSVWTRKDTRGTSRTPGGPRTKLIGHDRNNLGAIKGRSEDYN